MNLLCGFIAITHIIDGRYMSACWLIMLAGFFDVIDGFMARLTNGNSRFGVELDSLSDIVSFGVAPGLLIYQMALEPWGMLGLIVGSMPAICGAVRLARYNIEFTGDKAPYFFGLPVPAQAGGLVVMVMNQSVVTTIDTWLPGRIPVLLPWVLLLSFLMVSRIRFHGVPPLTPRAFRTRPLRPSLFLLSLLLILTLQEVGLFVSFVGYLAMELGEALLRFIQAVRNPEQDLQTL